jgi:hypothetical protein
MLNVKSVDADPTRPSTNAVDGLLDPAETFESVSAKIGGIVLERKHPPLLVDQLRHRFHPFDGSALRHRHTIRLRSWYLGDQYSRCLGVCHRQFRLEF